MEKNLMLDVKKIKYRKSISRRLIFYIVAFSSVITLMITAYQLVQDYFYGVGEIKDQMQQIEALSMSGLTHSLWNLYDVQIKNQLNDLIQLPNLHYLEIRFNKDIIASVGEDSHERTLSQVIPMFYQQYNENIFIGELYIVASLDEVYNSIYDKALVILISNAIKTTLVSTFIFFLFQYIVTRHLIAISEYLQRLSPENMNKRLSLKRKFCHDELNQVVSSINELSKNLQEKTVSKQYVEAIISSVNNSLIVVDSEHTIKKINYATCALLGYEENELIGKNVFDFLSHDRKHTFNNQEYQSKEIECTYLTKSGVKVPVLLSLSQFTTEPNNTTGYVLIARDITEQKLSEAKLLDYNEKLTSSNHELKLLQEQLIHSAKMVSIGQVTSGLAHEINQPLGSIQLNTELIYSIVQEDGSITKNDIDPIYKKVSKQINRITKIIQHLKIFTRDDTVTELEKTNFITLIDESLVLFSQGFSLNKINLVKNFEKKIPHIECNKIHIEQLITNILSNAEHALEGTNNKTIIIRLYMKESYLCMEIEDNGHGISPENLSKIFDPFFTTKQVGKGTGLGMSISYGIAQSHNGTLTVRSLLGSGTCFTLSLPIKQVDKKEISQKSILQEYSNEGAINR
ncbi:ATP-binding protein [Vibrio sp. Of7-15]|uniref:ATP-binding protein n=1 Tax=Vibrio sp. Of7-15 TaxID=2724879 RepID=UPI001EF35AAF|nr:ATP-binding protein [Vibrio sp. Of7-15]